MEYIKKTNVPMLLLCLVAIRMLFSDASIALAIFGLATTGLYAYKMYLNSKVTEPLSDEVKQELSEMRSIISNVSVKAGFKPTVKENQRYF
jgi:hypothetical protein